MGLRAAVPEKISEVESVGRRPWRVLFVITSSDFGGSESVLRELVSRLDRDEFEPLVCSLRSCGRVAEEIATGGTRVLSMDMSERPRRLELISGAVKLARWFDELRVDLVHSFLYRANVLARISARLSRRRPIVVSAQRSLNPLGGRWAALASRWTGGLSDRVVAVSGAVRDELIRREGVPFERIVVIENGVDTRHYAPADRVAARAQLGVDPGAIAVGTAGRLSPEKGCRYLLESVALARQRGLSIELIVAGGGPEQEALAAQAHSLALDDHVRFLGVQRDLRCLYAAIDVFALPSLEEGSPNALLEAMACGLPVIASRVGGVPEIVEHERSGLLVEPGASTALADALIRITTNDGLRRKVGTEARRRVSEQFEVSRMVERHAELYRELLPDTTRP